jgi:hypothetical protein
MLGVFAPHQADIIYHSIMVRRGEQGQVLQTSQATTAVHVAQASSTAFTQSHPPLKARCVCLDSALCHHPVDSELVCLSTFLMFDLP